MSKPPEVMYAVRRAIWLFGCVPVMLSSSLISLMFLGERLITSDGFGDTPAFYAAATLVQEAPAAAYDTEMFNVRIGEITETLSRPIDGGMFWHYPPIGYFVVAPLGWASLESATWIWAAMNICVFAVGVFVLAGRDARAFVLLMAPSVIGVLFMGQNGLLNAGLLALALAFAQRLPSVAGGWLAVLSYKPHVALPLLASWTLQGRFRALCAYLLVLGLLAGLSCWAYGLEAWRVFGEALLNAVMNDSGWSTGLSDRNVSLFVMLRELFSNGQLAALAVMGAACPVLVLLARTRRLSPTDPYVVLMLVTALPLLSPKAMDYDMVTLLLPVLLLGRRLEERGLGYADMGIVLCIWLGIPLLRFSDQIVALQVWPIVWLALFLYGAYRAGVLGVRPSTEGSTA